MEYFKPLLLVECTSGGLVLLLPVCTSWISTHWLTDPVMEITQKL